MCFIIQKIPIEVKIDIPEQLVATEDIICYKVLLQSNNDKTKLTAINRDHYKYTLGEIQSDEIDLKLNYNQYCSYDINHINDNPFIEASINEGYNSYTEIGKAYICIDPNDTRNVYEDSTSNLLTDVIEKIKSVFTKDDEDWKKENKKHIDTLSPVLARCYIPKGSKYYMNADAKEYVSSNIRIDEIIDINSIIKDPKFN